MLQFIVKEKLQQILAQMLVVAGEISRKALSFAQKRPKETAIAAGSFVFVILIVWISAALIFSGGGKKIEAEGPDKPQLKRYYFFREKSVLEKGMEEYVILPEKVNIEADKDFLKRSLGGSELFNQADDTVRYELGRLER